ncbi:hypothetical protein ACLB2K_045130 [Fragaria x ananassa]
MSNSGSGKRKAEKSKVGTMEVVDPDDEDEELDDDEDEEESDENVTGGLRLLRRGMVTMSRVNRRLVRGRKLRVKYNDDGEPVGRVAKEMQSYIGVLARTKVLINVKDWRLVALSVKDNIWGSVEEAYVVPKQWKKMVFASACQKWREFKSKLTTWYIIPYLDSPELFEFPPDDYRMNDVNQWTEFVKDRISPQFQFCKIQSVVISVAITHRASNKNCPSCSICVTVARTPINMNDEFLWKFLWHQVGKLSIAHTNDGKQDQKCAA